LASADAFYFPSFTESQPNSLIEAMIMGLPFVASDIQPIKEAILPDYYGQLVAPDNIEGAYKLFQEIIEDRMELDFKVLSQWASDNYNADKRFIELRDALLGSFSEK
jgi:glycosyltransferase involved in cell wall biosynthesis